jgi:hypothetical protein
MKHLFVIAIFWLPWALIQDNDDPSIARWQNEIAALETAQKSETTRHGIVFYGSSSIRLWNSISDDMAPWPVIKRGYGGAKLPDVIYFAPRILGPHLGQQNPNRCRAVVLFVANDITGNEATDLSPGEVNDHFEKLLKWIREQDSTIPVFWIEVTPTNSRWKSWPKICEASAGIRKLINGDCAAHFIPTAGAYIGPDGKPNDQLFAGDKLHLNADGYRLWSAIIKSHLQDQLGAAIKSDK